MDNQQLFVTQDDYQVPLLRLLSELPGGQGETAEVCRLFDERYGDRIPQEHRGWLQSGNQPKWYNLLRWNRANLKCRGFLDMPRRGVWRITEAGLSWLSENPGAARIPGSASSLVREGRPAPIPRPTKGDRPKTQRPPRSPDSPTELTLDTLEEIRKIMPAEDFRKHLGLLYDQQRAEARAKAITEITQGELSRRARVRLDEIHAFLQGKNTGSPSGEILCDWIHFCYALELHREAAALLPYVREAEVDPAVFRRAKRVAEVCRTRLAG